MNQKSRICLCVNNLVSYFEKVEAYQIDIALAILAREYKGAQNNGYNVIIEIKELDMNTVPNEAKGLRLVRTEEGKQNRKAYEEHTLEHKYLDGKEYDVRNDDICGTLTTHQKDNVIVTCAEVNYMGDWVWEKNGRFFQVEMRRLSSREAWRLMSFRDEDYEKAAAVTSKSQLLKQAGNSICELVLQAIFRQMMPKENET